MKFFCLCVVFTFILKQALVTSQCLRLMNETQAYQYFDPNVTIDTYGTGTTDACPNNDCPGLGNLFYLPDCIGITGLTGGNIIFKDRTVGSCVAVSPITYNNKEIFNSDSMESLVSHIAADIYVSGSYATNILTVKGVVNALTSQSSSLQTSFHSSFMDIMLATSIIDFVQNSTCWSKDNLDSTFLSSFESLPIIDSTNVYDSSEWAVYTRFLQDYGSHFMSHQYTGSRFQQWESTTSSSSNIETELQIKVCADVEGINTSNDGWSVNTCGNYNSSEKEVASQLSTYSHTSILGGTEETRAALIQDTNKANLDNFIASADEGSEAIELKFTPVWELLQQIYLPSCASSGKDSNDCKNYQRSFTIQAAYEGYIGTSCEVLKDGRGNIYQSMDVSGPNSLGIYSYVCKLAKTGCRNSNDCHIGSATVCYCYGDSCIDKGSAISALPGEYSDTIRTTQSGSYDSGVNNACYYHFIQHCDCNHNWRGGLPERNIYQQSLPVGTIFDSTNVPKSCTTDSATKPWIIIISIVIPISLIIGAIIIYYYWKKSKGNDNEATTVAITTIKELSNNFGWIMFDENSFSIVNWSITGGVPQQLVGDMASIAAVTAVTLFQGAGTALLNNSHVYHITLPAQGLGNLRVKIPIA